MDDRLSELRQDVVEALAASRAAAQVYDEDGRLAWVSEQLLELAGADASTEVGYGTHVAEGLELPLWASILSPDARHALREDLEARIGADGDAAPVWVCPVELDLARRRRPVGMLGVTVRAADGTIAGTALVFAPLLPARVLALVSEGDEAMFTRMAELTEPRRRPAAVVFADIDSSGPLSRLLPTPAYFELIRRFTTAFDDLVAEHAGIVGKHAGDGASAFFLAARAEDDGHPGDSDAAAGALAVALAFPAAVREVVEALAAEGVGVRGRRLPREPRRALGREPLHRPDRHRRPAGGHGAGRRGQRVRPDRARGDGRADAGVEDAAGAPRRGGRPRPRHRPDDPDLPRARRPRGLRPQGAARRGVPRRRGPRGPWRSRSRLPAVTGSSSSLDPEAWSDFAVATAGAAAALAGLLFVALSINITPVLASHRLTSRASSALVLLASPVFLALALLVPWGSPTPLGVVLLVLAVFIGTALGVMLPRPIAEVSRVAWFVTTAVPPVVLALGTLLAGVGLLVGGLGGLLWLAPAIAFGLFGGLVGAWVLLVEVLR